MELDKGFEEVSLDRGFEEVPLETSAPKTPTTSDSLLAGAETGLTMGSAPKIGGATQGGLDLARSLLNKLGLAGPSVSQTNANLQKQGFSVQGPTTSADVYDIGKQETAQEIEKAASENPGAYIAGNLLGGGLTGLGLAKAGVGVAAKGAPFMSRMGTAIKGGAAVGAGAEALSHDYNDQENKISQLLKAAGKGAIIGGATGAAAESIGSLLRASGKSGVAENYRIGKQLGKEGDFILDPQVAKTAETQLRGSGQVVQELYNDLIGSLGSEKKAILDRLTSEGRTVDLEPLVDEMVKKADALKGVIPDTEVEGFKQYFLRNIYSKLPETNKKAFTQQVTQRYGIDPESEEMVLKSVTKKITGKGATPSQLEEAGIPTDSLTPESASVTEMMSGETGAMEGRALQSNESAAVQTPGSKIDPMNPNEAAAKVKQFQDVFRTKSSPTTFAEEQKQELMKEFAAKASNLVEDLSPNELVPINEKLHTLLTSQDKDIGAPTFRTISGNKQVDPAVYNWIENLSKPFKPGVKDVTENIQKTLAKSMGPEQANKYISNLTDFSKRYNTIKEVSTGTEKGTLYQIGHKIQNLPAIIGNITGLAQKQITDLATKVKLTGTPTSARLGRMLDSVSASPEEKRAAMMFAISQNKDYREILGSVMGL